MSANVPAVLIPNNVVQSNCIVAEYLSSGADGDDENCLDGLDIRYDGELCDICREDYVQIGSRYLLVYFYRQLRLARASDARWVCSRTLFRLVPMI